MARVGWRLKGEWVKSCNCAFGCPCDLNTRPTNGDCEAVVGMRVTDGHFGEVRPDGLNFCVACDFAGPLDVVYGPGAPAGIARPEPLTSGVVTNAFERAAARPARRREAR